ncbi:hypothetical protein EKG37_08550 [Robertmurraya yapensis]|uniref:Uncharacterized protein n=2 Tax=Bacillaceae TaxID=186817 RepID=A0A431WCQ5_9BACI|nr:hypothetical protein [Bacillus yapensis]RTR33098.1 hypothetical protein EKG37_08550 [Bacillus yapensis]TKS96921.1 hypothetical protein FAR12_08550 [Bacillus yapensis]
MKLNTVKGKIVAGVVTIGLVSGVGAAFADSNVAVSLQNWYNKQFNTEAAKMEQPLRDYAEQKTQQVINEGLAMLRTANSEIDDTKVTSITNSTSSINQAANAHITALQTKETAIYNNIEKQFDGIENTALSMLNKMAVEGRAYAERYLEQSTSSTGSQAVTKVNEELTNVKNAAVQKLKKEIESSKTDLYNKLTTERDASVQSLKNAVDAKILEVKTAVQATLNGYVSDQQKLIQDKAAEIEGSAKTELDNAVNNGFND